MFVPTQAWGATCDIWLVTYAVWFPSLYFFFAGDVCVRRRLHSRGHNLWDSQWQCRITPWYGLTFTDMKSRVTRHHHHSHNHHQENIFSPLQLHRANSTRSTLAHSTSCSSWLVSGCPSPPSSPPLRTLLLSMWDSAHNRPTAASTGPAFNIQRVAVNLTPQQHSNCAWWALSNHPTPKGLAG